MSVLSSAFLVSACTYDFQDFVADEASGGQGSQGGASARGGNSSGNGGATSSGGVHDGGAPAKGGATANGGVSGSAGAFAGGAPNSTGGVASGGAPSTACAGASLNDVCWYLGNVNESCNVVCTDHGGVDAAAEKVVGVPAQGGSVAACAAVLTRLGTREAPAEATRSDGNGLGCHVYGGRTTYWLSSPRFSATAHAPNASIACGCNR